jgi:hypothetical protein
MLRAFVVFLLLAPLAALAWPLSEAEVDALAPGCLCSATDADFDGLRYPEQIPHCVRNVSTQTKAAVKRKFGISPGEASRFSIDHRISLWAGGSNEVCNLVPIDAVKHENKNAMEARLRARLQVGSVSHSEVIEAFQRWYQDCFFNDICE